MTSRSRAVSAAQDVIEILDPNLRLGFAQMPRPVLRAVGLSRNAKTLYALLLDYAWQDGSCFPGQVRLASDLDISVDTLKRDLDELRRYGLLTWKQRGMNQTNVYYILPLNECPHLNLKSAKPELESADLPHPDSADLRNPDSANTRIPESADSRILESANARKQESARLRSKKDAASPDPEHQTQTTTHRTRAAHASQSSVVVVQQVTVEEENPLVGKLVAAGVTAAIAKRLCASYPATRIGQQLEVLAYLRRTRPGEVKEPAAWLRTAIEQDWAAPRGFQSAARREAEQAARIAAYAEQASMHELLSPPPALASPVLPNSDTWGAVLARLRPYLSDDKLALLGRTRLLPYLPGQRVARVAVASLFERSQLQPLELHHLELALSEALGESVAVEVVLG